MARLRHLGPFREVMIDVETLSFSEVIVATSTMRAFDDSAIAVEQSRLHRLAIRQSTPANISTMMTIQAEFSGGGLRFTTQNAGFNIFTLFRRHSLSRLLSFRAWAWISCSLQK